MQQEQLEMDETLEQIIFYCLEQAQTKLDAGEELTPFTALVDGDKVITESFPGDDVDACRASAEAAIRAASAFASHYAFCYDGFLVTDEGELDAIIVEAAERAMENAYVIGLLYTQTNDGLEYAEAASYIDDAEQLFDAVAVKEAMEREQALKEGISAVDDAAELLKKSLSGNADS